ncbi:MAG: hypothetical protein ACHQX3_02810 [Nitrospirales bacterium]|jgi:hypothetical protein
MKTILPSLVIALLIGCALFQGTTEERIYKLSYAASSIGADTDMKLNPAHRPGFELAWSALDDLITKTNLTGQGLRDALAKLPIKELHSPKAIIGIEQATFLLDLATGGKFNIETNGVYIVAFGKGVHDGIGVALGK